MTRTSLPGLLTPKEPPASRKPFVHNCEHPGCEAWGANGFECDGGRRGRWFCNEHKEAGNQCSLLQPSNGAASL